MKSVSSRFYSNLAAQHHVLAYGGRSYSTAYKSGSGNSVLFLVIRVLRDLTPTKFGWMTIFSHLICEATLLMTTELESYGLLGETFSPRYFDLSLVQSWRGEVRLILGLAIDNSLSVVSEVGDEHPSEVRRSDKRRFNTVSILYVP
jgi:hypothetical protein